VLPFLAMTLLMIVALWTYQKRVVDKVAVASP